MQGHAVRADQKKPSSTMYATLPLARHARRLITNLVDNSSVHLFGGLSSQRSFISQNSGLINFKETPPYALICQRLVQSGRYDDPRAGSFTQRMNSMREGKDVMGVPNSINKDVQSGISSKSMNYMREILSRDGKGVMGASQLTQHSIEHDADFVHIKLMRNNTFVTVTDSNGNKKLGASVGCLSELKGGPKLSRYAAEATAEHVGRLSRSLGIKSVVMRVKGFTFFKKKRQAIMSWKEGFSEARLGKSPIVYIEDVTRKAHNGCRLPKKRRI